MTLLARKLSVRPIRTRKRAINWVIRVAFVGRLSSSRKLRGSGRRAISIAITAGF